MNAPRLPCERPLRRRDGGYLIVMFVVIVAFVGVVAAMQVLVLTSVATTSRAYDGYRQGAAEMTRLEKAVVETLLDLRQISATSTTQPLATALNAHVQQLVAGGATVTATTLPASIPSVVTFPDSTSPADTLAPVPADLQPFLTPELALLIGPRVTSYAESEFVFSSERTVLDITRTYRTQVKARLIAAPLTRFPIAAYDLPADIGQAESALASGPISMLPMGLAPSRDAAFVTALQAQRGILPYHYRRRAALAAAYQYVFSQPFIDRVAEYSGITHYHDIDTLGGTATLAGMSVSGSVTSWDLGVAGDGTYGTITMAKNAAVVFTQQPARTLRLFDSVGATNAPAMLVLALGPADSNMGPLIVDLSTIARPLVIVGYNVRVTAGSGVALNGALFLDPASTVASDGPITVGHLSYWAGSASIPRESVVAGPMPLAAEEIAPRVVYVATRAARL